MSSRFQLPGHRRPEMACQLHKKMKLFLDDGIGSELGSPTPSSRRGQAGQFRLGVARWHVGLDVHGKA